MSERYPIDPLSRSAFGCLGLILLAAGLTVGRVMSARAASPARADITVAFRGDGRLDRSAPTRPGGEVGEFDARALIPDGGPEVEVPAEALRMVGHDDAGRLLLFARTDGLLETGPMGETVLYVATGPGRYVRLLVQDSPSP